MLVGEDLTNAIAWASGEAIISWHFLYYFIVDAIWHVSQKKKEKKDVQTRTFGVVFVSM